MKHIFEPVKMNHIELKNRLVRSATWEGIARPDGSISSEAYTIYEELARGGVGGFRSADVMESILNHSKIELISLSRPLLREPDLPAKMKADPSVISKCVSCNACYSSYAHKCIFRKEGDQI